MHLDLVNDLLIHDQKHEGIEIKFYSLDTFKKQVDANCIDLESEFVDLNYKVASLIFCHFWRRIRLRQTFFMNTRRLIFLSKLKLDGVKNSTY